MVTDKEQTELGEILPCTCVMNDLLNGKHYDDCPKSLRQALLDWRDKAMREARLDELNKLPWTKVVSGGIEFEAVIRSQVANRKLHLEALNQPEREK